MKFWLDPRVRVYIERIIPFCSEQKITCMDLSVNICYSHVI